MSQRHVERHGTGLPEYYESALHVRRVRQAGRFAIFETEADAKTDEVDLDQQVDDMLDGIDEMLQANTLVMSGAADPGDAHRPRAREDDPEL